MIIWYLLNRMTLYELKILCLLRNK